MVPDESARDGRTAEEVDADAIVDRLTSIHRDTGIGLGRVFRDWVGLAVLAFARDDEAYRDRLDRYDQDEATHRRSAEAFSTALGDLVAATAAADRPILGDVYERVGARSDHLGQHFTPWSLSLGTVQTTLTDDDLAAASESDPLTVADPACGSGRLLVAVARVAHEADGKVPVVVRGTDKDPTCARMTVLNLVIAGIPGRVRQGNSLTQEMRRGWAVRPESRPLVREVEPVAHAASEANAGEADEAADEEPADSVQVELGEVGE